MQDKKELIKRYTRELRAAKELSKEGKREQAALSAGAAAALGEILGEKYYIKAMSFIWNNL